MENEKFCSEHGTQCYQLSELRSKVESISAEIRNNITKEDFKTTVSRLEHDMGNLKNSIIKEIDELKLSDRIRNDDIMLIKEAITEINTTLRAYKEAQEILREDYRRLYDLASSTYLLIQTKLQDKIEDVENDLQRINENQQSSGPWEFVKSNANKLMPIIYVGTGALIFLVIKYAEKIIELLLK